MSTRAAPLFFKLMLVFNDSGWQSDNGVDLVENFKVSGSRTISLKVFEAFGSAFSPVCDVEQFPEESVPSLFKEKFLSGRLKGNSGRETHARTIS